MRHARSGLKLPVLSLLTLLFGLLLHEAGHALAAFATHGHIAEFVIFSGTPHITIDGTASLPVEALRIAAGSLLSLTFSFIVLMVFGWNTSIVTETLSLFCLIEITGWFSSAIHPADANDDATAFMLCTGISGADLAMLCAGLGGVAVFLIARRSQCLSGAVAEKTVADALPQVASPLA